MVLRGGIVGEEVVCEEGSVWNRVMNEGENAAPALGDRMVTAYSGVVWSGAWNLKTV